MESISKFTRFTIPTDFKVFADSKENIIIYNRTSTHSDNFSGPHTPQVKFVQVIEQAHKANTSVLKPFTDSQTNKNHLLSASFDKELKLWDLSSNPPSLLSTLKLAKKIDFGFLALEQNKFYFSDKTGDIFETSIESQEGTKVLSLSPQKMVHANMDTLTYLERFSLADGRELMVLADEYEKLKVFKYPEIYHMFNVYSPYRQVNFTKVLNLSPNAFAVLLNNGEIDLIDLTSLETNDYTSKRLDAKTKLNGKHISDICRIDSDCLIAIDNYFTEVVIYQIKGSDVIKEKVVDITDLKILREEKDHNKKRFIEAEKVSSNVNLIVKYERSEGDASPGEVKLYDNVYFTELVINF